MTEFDKLCQEAEDIDWETRCAIVRGKSREILPLLQKIDVEGSSGAEILLLFIFASMTADGRLSEEEYALLYPLLKDFLGDDINYSDAKKAVKDMKAESKELKAITEKMIDVIGSFSPELRKDVVLVVMVICASDGRISLRERAWIRRLLF